MRKFTLLTVAALLLSSACSPVLYQQIATLESENVQLKGNGAFVYEDAAVIINCDFWSEYGKFSFVVTNNSDDNLYLILSDSYFINNGFAFDYYRGRKFISTSRSTTSTSSSSTRYSSQGRNLSVSFTESADFQEIHVTKNLLTAELKNYKKLVNPDKIFLGSPNIMYALGGKTETGTIRETFFAN